MYLRTDDSVVKFIVDMGDSADRNYIYYFPTGLQWDKTVTGVWDFNMKYGDCPANQGQSLILTNPISMASGLKHMHAAFPAKPESVQAEPTVLKNVKIGGIRSHFMRKNLSLKAKVLPEIHIAQEDSQEVSEVPLELSSLFKNKILKSLSVFQNNKEVWEFVDEVFAQWDLDQDGFISVDDLTKGGAS